MSSLKKVSKPKDNSWLKCCLYCRNFDRSEGVCTSNELVSVSYEGDVEVCDVYINNPDTFYCSAWE